MQRQAEPFPSFKFYAVVWRHDDGSAHVTAIGSSAIALCRIRKHASQSPSRCVVSQFLLGCSTRFREACIRRLYFRLEWRVLQEFYALCYHLLTLSCVSHPVVYIFCLSLSHSSSVLSLLCLWAYAAMWCYVLFVREVSYLWHPHTVHRMTRHITCFTARAENRKCVYIQVTIFFLCKQHRRNRPTSCIAIAPIL